MAWQTPYTQRTKNHVDDVKSTYTKPYDEWTDIEKIEYGYFKFKSHGSLNYEDLRRIEGNMEVLSDVFDLGLTTYPNWNYYAFSTENNTREYNNLVAIKNACAGFATTPNVPPMPWNTWDKWNDVEQILLDIYNIVQSNLYYLSIDDIRCGEEAGLLL